MTPDVSTPVSELSHKTVIIYLCVFLLIVGGIGAALYFLVFKKKSCKIDSDCSTGEICWNNICNETGPGGSSGTPGTPGPTGPAGPSGEFSTHFFSSCTGLTGNNPPLSCTGYTGPPGFDGDVCAYNYSASGNPTTIWIMPTTFEKKTVSSKIIVYGSCTFSSSDSSVFSLVMTLFSCSGGITPVVQTQNHVHNELGSTTVLPFNFLYDNIPKGTYYISVLVQPNSSTLTTDRTDNLSFIVQIVEN